MAAEKAMKQETGVKVAKVSLDSKMLQLQHLGPSLKKNRERGDRDHCETFSYMAWSYGKMHIPTDDSLSLCELGIKQKRFLQAILPKKCKETYPNLDKVIHTLAETKPQLYKATMKIQTTG